MHLEPHPRWSFSGMLLAIKLWPFTNLLGGVTFLQAGAAFVSVRQRLFFHIIHFNAFSYEGFGACSFGLLWVID